MELNEAEKTMLFCFQNLQELENEGFIDRSADAEYNLITSRGTSEYDQMMAAGFKPGYIEIYLTVLSLPEISLEMAIPITGLLAKISDNGFDETIAEFREWESAKNDRISEDELDSEPD